MRFEQAALAVVTELNARGLSYALIGGFAASVRTNPRFTQDIDLVVAVADDVAAEAVVSQLAQKRFAILAIVEYEARERLATVRLGLPSGLWVADLLFASSGIESEIIELADRSKSHKVCRSLWRGSGIS